MTTRIIRRTVGLALALGALTLPSRAWAHGAEHDDVTLHLGDDYGSCYFDLHSDLTPVQFRKFAAEGGQLSQFRTLSSAEVLGPWVFDVAVAMTHSFIDDGDGAWNNTMSHPEEDHYLGAEVSIPLLMVRMGVTDSVDLEVSGTYDFRANYGFLGVGAKIALLQQKLGAPVSVAIRPSVSTLIGPAEVSLASLSTELLVSRSYYHLAAFVGVGARGTIAFDSSADTNVGNQGALRPVVLAGLEYDLEFLSLGAQVDYSTVLTLAARVGVRF
ncbi:MAG: hypothetical protein CVU56_28280 [Deltaproteobacteria bacterium HGW-Deltaproteobacteria-14]|jgi:hypothetical protein|nr:MAG: hypothetical protein CVU56_28280 [Deltaproteobacteria bacterium HGW-Deltaproteobacteria-14]